MSGLMLAAILMASPQQSTPRLQAQLDASVGEYSLMAGSLLQALHRVATDFKLPMGVEWMRDNDSLKPVRLSWTGTSVKNVIERVVAEYPAYRISTDRSIIHVFRDDIRSDPTNPLELRLGPLEINEELSTASGLQLRSRVARLLRPSLSGGEGGSIAGGIGGDRLVSFKANNPTLREALDGFAVSASGVMWVVTYGPQKSGNIPARSTVTPGGRSVGPEHDPLWTFLAWGPPSLVKVSGR